MAMSLTLVACSATTRGLEVVEAPSETNEIPTTPDQVYSASHAVVIGISAYENISPTGGAKDALDMQTALSKQGFKVKALLDREATLQNVREALADDLRDQVQENDRVLVFFAGHGVSVGAGDAAMGYLLPVDGKKEKPAGSGISMKELQSWFRSYASKHVLFVADACYSGLALETRSVALSSNDNRYLRDITSKSVRFTLVAGRSDQEAHESGGRGVFTSAFLEAIEGAADQNRDTLITSDEIETYVKPLVHDRVYSEFSVHQTPQAARSGEGEFVFFAPRTECPSGTLRVKEDCVPNFQAGTP